MAKAGSEKAERLRQLKPKCGATKRSDGTPCRNVALENGRCRYHGGKTPKGRNWHKVQPPGRGAPIEKLGKKEEEVARRRQAQALRLAKMTPEERERYHAWHKSHAAGSETARDRARRNREARALLQRETAPSASREAEALAQRIAQLEAERERLARDREPPQKISTEERTPTMTRETPARVQEITARLQEELVPVALDTLLEIMQNKKAPAPARAQAAKAVLDRGLLDERSFEDALKKRSLAEIDALIEHFESMKAKQAKAIGDNVEDAEIVTPSVLN